MNKKADILDAWIMIEQLSEGDIKKKDIALKPFQSNIHDLYGFFTDFLSEQKKRHRLLDEAFKKSGLVMYFDIFDFQEVIDILRKKYNIEPTYEEIKNTDKFTFCLYFDHHLNFLADKVFLTISGYIRENGELPKDFLKEESAFREDFTRMFEEEFNVVVAELFQKYNVSKENFRYAFIKNLEYDDLQMHSFFIEDLQKAKQIESSNLKQYFKGISNKRNNLDSKKESFSFASNLFEELLQPERYPLGRFPSNPDYALSFMQQVAVNLALNDKNDIRSVNGPPGTGKTTLLKDIFADLLVQQALDISRLSSQRLPGKLIYWQQAKLGVLPESISSKNIIVASSNNGAVQNIVNELPKQEGIANRFQTMLTEVDYFTNISNSQLSSEWVGKERTIQSVHSKEENWGNFSLEGGTSSNTNKLLLNIEFMENYLEEEYVSNPDVYKKFSELYKQLDKERQTIQHYRNDIQKLLKLKSQYKKQSIFFEEEKQKNYSQLKDCKTETTMQLERFEQKRQLLEKELSDISSQLKSEEENKKQEQQTFDIIRLQKPAFLGLQKLLNTSKAKHYLQQLHHSNEILICISKQINNLLKSEKSFKQNFGGITKEIDSAQRKMDQLQSDFDQLVLTQQAELEALKQKIEPLEQLKSQSNIEELDFTKSYEVLQKSNPWFTNEFRIRQSELFIVALEVRKQFLYENKKHLKTARMIWSQPSNYLSKENGQQLITESWQWINFAIPVVSTTFASFGRMFKHLGADSIGNLFVDEAGQALPQASVGAIFRSKKVMVVGDPSQIKPVVTLDSNVLNLIGQYHKVDEKFVSSNASTQTLVDATSQYGFWKNEEDWIGIPLWVHRRSKDPMFTISNQLSYEGLMVQGKSEHESQGKAAWYHCSGVANDKFVKEQAILLKELIEEQLQNNPESKDDIYVISPFRNVAYKLAQTLEAIHFTKYDKGKSTNVGTVHTFQGKEAKIVYFVLGADSTSKGAAKWAVSDANMMNVAVTRAKEEFYIIGDKNLYASLGSKVAHITISLIDNYNKSF